MNILNKIKKEWNFKKDIKENVLYFNTAENQEKKNRKRMIWFALTIVVLGMFVQLPHLIGMVFVFGLLSYNTAYSFGTAPNYWFVKAMSSTTFVVAYSDGSHQWSKIGTVSGTSISYGSAYEVDTNKPCNFNSIEKIDSTHFIIAYYDATSGAMQSIIGTISGTSISYGSVYNIPGGSTQEAWGIGIALLDSTHFVLSYLSPNPNYYGYVTIGTISSVNVISYGTAAALTSSVRNSFLSVCVIDSTHFVVAYTEYNSGSYANGHARIGTVSGGNSISLGTVYDFNTTGATQYISIVTLDSTHVCINFSDVGAGTYAGTSIIGTISSGAISYGSKYAYAGFTFQNSLIALDSTHIAIAWRNISDNEYGYGVVGVVSSGNVITFDTAYKYYSTGVQSTPLTNLDSTNIVFTYANNALIGVYSVVTNVTVSATVLSATLSTPASSVSLGVGVSPSAQSMVSSLPSIAVLLGIGINPNPLTAIFSLPVPEVITPDVLILPSAVVATFSLPPPSIDLDMVILSSVLSATLSSPGATVSGVAIVSPGVIAMTFDMPQSQVNLDMVIATAVQEITSSIGEVTVIPETRMIAGVQVLTLTIPAITILLDSVIHPSPVDMYLSVNSPYVKSTQYGRKYTVQNDVYGVKYI